MKRKNSLLFYFLLVSFAVNAQDYSTYKYQRKLEGIGSQWHSVIIPNEVFDKINTDFSDVRIIGVQATGDTIEAPYVLKVFADTYSFEPVNFNLINQVKNGKGYYYTFEIPDHQFVNYMDLDFNKSNFDWVVSLEGSQNQEEWFTLLDKSRVISIENDFSNYKYTTLKFDKAKFNYFRLFIPTTTNPKLGNVKVKKNTFEKGKYRTPKIVYQQIEDSKNGTNTEIIIELESKLPISSVIINVLDSIDYYRPLLIQYAIDSVKNNSGWHPVYSTIYATTLSSITKREFKFANTPMKKLKLIINNGDSEPLNYELTNLRGDVHQLAVRFNEKASYYLIYGNKEAYMPNYDVSRFKINIPTNLSPLDIGDEVELLKEETGVGFIKNDLWLWAIMIFVIFILGWFSIKMMKEK